MAPIFGLSSQQETGGGSGRENWTEEENRTEIKFEEPDPSPGSDDAMEDPAATTPLEVVVPLLPADGQHGAAEPEIASNKMTERNKVSDREDEFYQFGVNVGCQLRAMPLRAALEAQLEIQRVLTIRRLECLE
ncbi:uncharacterized protein [Procambarus clarkii]|uniref:uncharacterized protein isoform X1 n=1 Tax=Procambarus clarkii TaxID=6728 RepID=UPI003742B1C8